MQVQEIPTSTLVFPDEVVVRKHDQDRETISDYTEVYKATPDEMPPLRVFRIADYPGKHVVSRGRHRGHAAVKAGLKNVKAEVFDGTLDDAMWDAAGDNESQRGLRRTHADRTVATRVAIIARPRLTDSAIADQVGVSVGKVAAVRKAMEADGVVEAVEVREGANGKTYPKREGSKAKAASPDELVVKDDPQPAAAPPPLRDANGDEIPRGALDVFQDNRLRDFVEDVKQAHLTLAKLLADFRELRKLEKRLPWVKWGKLMVDTQVLVNTAVDVFEAADQGLPFALCPECGGKGCAHCHRSGYYPKWRYENKMEYGSE